MHKDDLSTVNERNFWPRGVRCDEWRDPWEERRRSTDDQQQQPRQRQLLEEGENPDEGADDVLVVSSDGDMPLQANSGQ